MSALFPLPTYNYRVRIADKVIAFSEVSGLHVEHEELVYRHGLSEIMGVIIQRGFAKPVNISLKKGMILSAESGEISSFLHDTFSSNEPLDIAIDLCDEQGTALMTWKVVGAVPLKYQLPELQADSNSVSIESIDLTGRKLLIN